MKCKDVSLLKYFNDSFVFEGLGACCPSSNNELEMIFFGITNLCFIQKIMYHLKRNWPCFCLLKLCRSSISSPLLQNLEIDLFITYSNSLSELLWISVNWAYQTSFKKQRLSARANQKNLCLYNFIFIFICLFVGWFFDEVSYFCNRILSNPSETRIGDKKLSVRQRLSLDINISTKYIYVRKHTHNKNEKVLEIMFCECNENWDVRV